MLRIILLVFIATNSLAATVTPKPSVSDHVNIRELPSTSEGDAVGRLLPGQSLPHLESVPYWYKIQLPDGSPGFVSKRYTTLQTQSIEDEPFTLHMLDVGVGDSIIIDQGDREIIIDGGNYKYDLAKYLNETGIIDGAIELGIVTHGDSDHWKGFSRVLGFDKTPSPNPYQLIEFWDPGYDRDCRRLQSYDTFIDQIKGHVANFKRPLDQFHTPAVVSGTPEPFTLPSLPGIEFTLLHADPAPTQGNCAYKINNASIVFKMVIGGVSILFTGDANGKSIGNAATLPPKHVEEKLLALEAAHPGILKADVLKVPHHGSETASTQRFIDAVNPDFVLISASTNHHLPRPSVINRYTIQHRIILRTDIDRARGNDHILCTKSLGQPLNCNYRDQFIN